MYSKAMEMEVVIPVAAAMDFNFDSNCSSPYMTAPSSPQRFGNFFFSAPASPSRISAFYRELNDHSKAASNSSAKVFNAEEANNKKNDDEEEDFEFNFSGQLERTSLSADELFDGGKIRPLKPPTGYESGHSSVPSPKPTSRSRNNSQRRDPDLSAAMEDAQRKGAFRQQSQEQKQQQRGRDRSISGSSSFSSCSRKGTRSLSPIRVSDVVDEQEDNSQGAKIITSNPSNTKSYASSILSAISFSKGSRKWKLKDLLLFRSASEGRATSPDPLRKYSVLPKKETAEDVKNSSFRSTDSNGSVSRRRIPVSAHELHYTANRAVAEEMKRKTFLPYKQGLLGCLGFNFNPSGVHDISKGVGSLTRG